MKRTSFRVAALAWLAAFAFPAVHAQEVERRPDRTQDEADAAPPAKTPRAFEELDTNADGAIGKDEAAVDPPLAQVFGTLDEDADGRLTPEEYAAYAPGKP